MNKRELDRFIEAIHTIEKVWSDESNGMISINIRIPSAIVHSYIHMDGPEAVKAIAKYFPGQLYVKDKWDGWDTDPIWALSTEDHSRYEVGIWLSGTQYFCYCSAAELQSAGLEAPSTT